MSSKIQTTLFLLRINKNFFCKSEHVFISLENVERQNSSLPTVINLNLKDFQENEIEIMFLRINKEMTVISYWK